MTIGELARQAGVGVETVRYYERRGLLPRPGRRNGGYRQYTEETLKRLRFIRKAKDIGFSLREIAELLALRSVPGSSCGEVKVRSEARLDDIRRRIKALRRMEKVLSRLSASCKGRGPLDECHILEALEGD